MRIAAFLLPALLSSTACVVEGPPCDCGEFGPGDFTPQSNARSSLEAVTSTCERYCSVASECGQTADVDECVADCVEPKLVAAQPEAGDGCSEEHEAVLDCTAASTCEELTTCQTAVESYVECTLAPR